MSLPYVCLNCSRRLAVRTVQIRRRVKSGWSCNYSAGSFAEERTSLSQIPDQRPDSTESEPRSKRYSRNDFPGSIPRSSTSRAAQTSNDSTANHNASRQRSAGRYSATTRPDALDTVASNNYNQDAAPQAARPWVSDLEDALNHGRTYRAWRHFQQHCTAKDCSALKNPSLQDMVKIQSRAVFVRLLSQCVETWLARARENDKPSDIPAPLEVLEDLDSLGITTESMYTTTIWILSHTLAAFVSEGLNVHEHDGTRKAVNQLMEVWERLFALHPPRGSIAPHAVNGATAATSSLSFASPLTFRRKLPPGHDKFDALFSMIVPTARIEKSRLSDSALLTYDLLVHGADSNYKHATPPEVYRPFTISMDQLFSRSVLPERYIAYLRSQYQNWMKLPAVDFLIQRLQTYASQNRAKVDLSSPKKVERQIGPAVAHHFPEIHESKDLPTLAQTYGSALSRAIERQSLDSVEQLWTSARDTLPSPKQDQDRESLLQIYERFMFAFLKLRRPQSAIEVWNAMVDIGIEPTVRTWTVLMKGCQNSRDAHIMESMWQRMRVSGIQPDVQAWSTRIHGLFRTKNHHEGLKALDEMGLEWSKFAKQTQSNAAPKLVSDQPPKPDTAILNSAITGLGFRFDEYFPRILGWSRGFDIDFDIITYNALLNVLLAQGLQTEAADIMRRMAAANIEPDSDTFTILIDSMFRSAILRDMSPREQETHVMKFVTSLETNKVRINDKGYAILIDRLLKEYSNISAAHRVLRHMAERRVEPTRHIYTILMTHYFAQDPPDLPAAEALWDRLQRNGRNQSAPLDVIFFDRMVEGYARHSDVGRMMAFLTRMSKEGKRPGWLAMTAVIKCLADKNDWDRLLQIVNDCHRHEGLLSAGLRGTKGQAEFWQLAGELGALDSLRPLAS